MSDVDKKEDFEGHKKDHRGANDEDSGSDFEGHKNRINRGANDERRPATTSRASKKDHRGANDEGHGRRLRGPQEGPHGAEKDGRQRQRGSFPGVSSRAKPGRHTSPGLSPFPGVGNLSASTRTDHLSCATWTRTDSSASSSRSPGVVLRALEQCGDAGDGRLGAVAAARPRRGLGAPSAGGRARSRPGSRTGSAGRSRRARTLARWGGRAPGARRARARRSGAAPPSGLGHVARRSAAWRAKRGSCCRSSITSGCRVTSTQPAMPVLDGNPHPDEVALALARDGLEHELVGRARRAGRSTRPWRRRSPARRRRSTAAAPGGSPRMASMPVATASR